MWFAILIGTALMVVDRRWRVPAAPATGDRPARAGAGCRRRTAARAAATPMDALWIEALRRRFHFANQWPLWAWTANPACLRRCGWRIVRACGAAPRLPVRSRAHLGCDGSRGALPDHAAGGGCRACGARRAVSVLPCVLDRRSAIVAMYGIAAIGEALLAGTHDDSVALVLLAASAQRRVCHGARARGTALLPAIAARIAAGPTRCGGLRDSRWTHTSWPILGYAFT